MLSGKTGKKTRSRFNMIKEKISAMKFLWYIYEYLWKDKKRERESESDKKRER